MNKLRLISAEVCPFAQRTLILLAEKKLEYELLEVDLENKPKWFEETSPYSKVPVLQHGDINLYESSIINEYINEEFPNPPMMPLTTMGRATARIWIDYDNAKFIPLFYKVLLAKNINQRRDFADAILDSFRFLEKKALENSAIGPFWLGKSFSLVDAAIYPHFERLPVLEYFRGIKIPNECAAIRDWMAAVAEKPSVQITAHSPEFHIKAYTTYADGSANGSTAKDMHIHNYAT